MPRLLQVKTGNQDKQGAPQADVLVASGEPEEPVVLSWETVAADTVGGQELGAAEAGKAEGLQHREVHMKMVGYGIVSGNLEWQFLSSMSVLSYDYLVIILV